MANKNFKKREVYQSFKLENSDKVILCNLNDLITFLAPKLDVIQTDPFKMQL